MQQNPPTTIIKSSNQYQYNSSQDIYIDAKYDEDIIQNTPPHTPTHPPPTANTTTEKDDYKTTANYYAALEDTAATHNYFEDKVSKFCNNLRPAYGPNVKVANGSILTPTQQGTLGLSKKYLKKPSIVT